MLFGKPLHAGERIFARRDPDHFQAVCRGSGLSPLAKHFPWQYVHLSTQAVRTKTDEADLDLKTFAFGLPDLSELDEAHVADMLREDPGMTYQPVQMPSPPPGVPESLSSPNPFDSTELDWTSLHIKLIDFEGCKNIVS